jgi:hypothetical protein
LTSDLSEHSEHLLGGDHHQAEGQVSGYFDGASDMYMPTSVLLVQMGFDQRLVNRLWSVVA